MPAWIAFPLGFCSWADTKASTLFTTPASFSSRPIAYPPAPLGTWTVTIWLVPSPA